MNAKWSLEAFKIIRKQEKQTLEQTEKACMGKLRHFLEIGRQQVSKWTPKSMKNQLKTDSTNVISNNNAKIIEI